MRHGKQLAAVPALALLVAVALGAGAMAQTAPPNLTITNFSGPACAEIGEVIGGQVVITERNDGGSLPPPPGTDCSGQVNTTCSSIGFYISADADVTTSDTLLTGGRENLFSELGAGVPFNTNDTISNFLFSGASIATGSPIGDGINGPYLGVIVDEFNTVSEGETGESDNTAWVPIQIVAAGSGECGASDLVVDSLTHDPASPNTEDNIEFTAVVKNVGAAWAGASTLCFEIGGESCSLQPSDTLFDVPGLAAGETFSVTRFSTLGTARDYLNTAIADYSDAVVESDEQNNTTTDSFSVSQAEEPVALVYQITRLPEHGTLQGLDTCSLEVPCSLPSVKVTYEPEDGFVGNDTFEFRVLDTRTGLTSVIPAVVGILVANAPGFGVDLTVIFQGAGSGDVTMDIGGTVAAICPDDCTQSFGPGQVVKLQGRPIDEFTFDGWGGACAIAGSSQIATITLPSTGGSTCTATFGPAPD
jgi:hypothetical protein